MIVLQACNQTLSTRCAHTILQETVKLPTQKQKHQNKLNHNTAKSNKAEARKPTHALLQNIQNSNAKLKNNAELMMK